MPSFGESMRDVLGLTGYVNDQYQQGVERKRKSTLADLMGTAASGGPVDAQGIARAGGDPFAVQGNVDKMQDRSLQEIGRAAEYLKRLPPELRAQAYPGMRGKFEQFAQRVGLPPPPPMWDESHAPELDAVIEYANGSQTGTNVQSSFVDAQGRRMAIMRDGTVRELGQNAPNNQIIAADGGYYGVNKGNLTAAPVVVGGGPQMPSAPTQAPQGNAPGKDDAIMAAMSYMVQQGMDPKAVEAWGMQQLGGAPPDAGGAASAPQVAAIGSGQQLQPAPKPVAPPKPPPGYRWQPDGSLVPIPGGPAQAALDAKAVAAEAKLTAAKTRQAEASSSASELVAAIDTLTSSPGFSSLGTAWGDVQIGTPMVRNDAKDARAQLQNVAGQIALTTMARLKALSATGATGFGALTAPELTLLKNSLAALQDEDISNEELTRSLKVVKEKMQKIAEWKAQEDSAPAAAPAGNGWSIKPKG